jgi:hypothetical protein
MALMEQPRQIVAQLVPIPHGGLEQRLLNVARHLTPHADRGLAEQLGEPVVVTHVAPPDLLTSGEYKCSVVIVGNSCMEHKALATSNEEDSNDEVSNDKLWRSRGA